MGEVWGSAGKQPIFNPIAATVGNYLENNQTLVDRIMMVMEGGGTGGGGEMNGRGRLSPRSGGSCRLSAERERGWRGMDKGGGLPRRGGETALYKLLETVSCHSDAQSVGVQVFRCSIIKNTVLQLCPASTHL